MGKGDAYSGISENHTLHQPSELKDEIELIPIYYQRFSGKLIEMNDILSHPELSADGIARLQTTQLQVTEPVFKTHIVYILCIQSAMP